MGLSFLRDEVRERLRPKDAPPRPDQVNTHNMRCDFGRHRGTLYTRMPLSYLRWMVKSGHSRMEVAEAELARRGSTELPSLDVSGHAVDKASLRLVGKWRATRLSDEEGLHSWLLRMAAKALDRGDSEDDGAGGQRVTYSGVVWVFAVDGGWPTLKTVMPAKQRRD